MSTDRYRRGAVDADLVYSPDDGGWYASDFGNDDRTTRLVYPTRAELVAALDADGPDVWET